MRTSSRSWAHRAGRRERPPSRCHSTQGSRARSVAGIGERPASIGRCSSRSRRSWCYGLSRQSSVRCRTVAAISLAGVDSHHRFARLRAQAQVGEDLVDHRRRNITAAQTGG